MQLNLPVIKIASWCAGSSHAILENTARNIPSSDVATGLSNPKLRFAKNVARRSVRALGDSPLLQGAAWISPQQRPNLESKRLEGRQGGSASCFLTMRLSDARLSRRPKKLAYPNHSLPSLAHRRR
jgi:hypothetical protein